MELTERWVLRLAPEPFREFLPYASPSALRVIHAKEVLRGALQVAQHFTSEAARARQASQLQQSLDAKGLGHRIRVLNEAPQAMDLAQLPEVSRTRMGDSVLLLYFHMLHTAGPLFLDLRPRNLGWDAESETLLFFPSTLWFEPEPDFMQRLRALYAGFYRNDGAELVRGLELYGWRCQPRPGFAVRMEKLLRAHFGAAGSGSMRFYVAHFRETFDQIFQEAKASDAKLHPELTFLGVGLVSMYLALEALGVALNPRASFDDCLQRGLALSPG